MRSLINLEDTKAQNFQDSQNSQEQVKRNDQQNPGSETDQNRPPAMFDELSKNRVTGQENEPTPDVCQNEIEPDL
jgi:hypothetical protein